jgi:nicotinic acid mononucleotide adenylyltransferase
MRKGYKIPETINMKNYTLFDIDILEISSTIVREGLKKHKSVEHLLTPKVYDYILKNKLYD